MPWNEVSPLAAAANVAAEFMAAQKQKKDQDYDRKQQEQATSFEQDQRRQAAALQAAAFQLQQQQFGEQQRMDNSALATESQNRSIQQAAAIFDANMRPLLLKYQQGQLDGQALDNAAKSIQNKLSEQFGAQEASLGIATGWANLGQINANTSATNASTARTNAMLPFEINQLGAQTDSTNANTDYTRSLTRGQNITNFNNSAITSGGIPPVDKNEEGEYRSRLSVWKQAQTSGANAGPQPVAPEVFRAQLRSLGEQLRKSSNPAKDLQDTIAGMTEKGYDDNQIRIAQQYLTSIVQGGSQGTSPFPVFPGP